MESNYTGGRLRRGTHPAKQCVVGYEVDTARTYPGETQGQSLDIFYEAMCSAATSAQRPQHRNTAHLLLPRHGREIILDHPLAGGKDSILLGVSSLASLQRNLAMVEASPLLEVVEALDQA
ncbi:uncharacterized protein N7482_008311 [Penicillium canariense]|uniref:Uncharacterized protein n=1 Tax=Penicillium canariense TaxID=189055 RepID=A0A9W9LHD4_9EURO|nr:uncharacterized protein N7482_008311 [Penicillium canariense]KAJ5157211.1 hypothetical protein N7482_008311 [Penicillium canariense]